MSTTGFSEAIAGRIAAEHAMLAALWFSRLRDLLPVDAEDVFPSDSLLDHIPSLILDISLYLRAPEAEAIAANTQVVTKARELGTLRHEQRASLHQVLREYQLLGSVLLRFVEDESGRMISPPPPAAECVAVVARLHHAVGVLLQETVETFVGLYTRTITDQSERLRQFTRMATHEWRQPLAPISTAVSLLRSPTLAPEQRTMIVEMIARNVAHLADMTYSLERVARVDGNDNASLQDMPLATVAVQATRQLKEMADARHVELIIADDMPSIVVDVGRLELALVNLISNAIKYSDPAKTRRVVKISAAVSAPGRIEIRVDDNGLGIAADRIDSIFDRFSRAHTDGRFDGISGIGLGLAIVDDCVRAMNGAITVESEEGRGTTFRLSLPSFASALALGGAAV